jgi:hypothetical protein
MKRLALLFKRGGVLAARCLALLLNASASASVRMYVPR